jgi:hypothetical protein
MAFGDARRRERVMPVLERYGEPENGL